MKFEKAFRIDEPESMGETESDDLDNYVEWLESKIEKLPILRESLEKLVDEMEEYMWKQPFTGFWRTKIKAILEEK